MNNKQINNIVNIYKYIDSITLADLVFCKDLKNARSLIELIKDIIDLYLDNVDSVSDNRKASIIRYLDTNLLTLKQIINSAK